MNEMHRLVIKVCLVLKSKVTPFGVLVIPLVCVFANFSTHMF